ncbi:hypothetical protein CAPTEDRAFT_168922 [Capitella teleta]|uniref:MIT domain-containing protein n=1 Tax=Capitella teleta TaxID=283909 RepID=R7TJN8_CAPTE|nr:hypothetical protein CAPTEDRAFT_154892 [Capitella teleta]ELU09533.1 hypothetical protein CAPTEDRAFT_168922 [Capitella teleta]|eukprot:ELT94043.1 hypothetical protein CAPTEDRAFT_154892 [Capitella teleta]
MAETAAVSLITRAVELDAEGRYDESLTFYQTGIQQLLAASKGITDPNKKIHFRKKVEEYMERAEKLKSYICRIKEAGKFHEQIQIAANATGYGYRRLFGRLLDPMLTSVEVEDPYIRNHHQILNFLRFCEVLVNSEAQVKSITLLTGRDENPTQQREQHSKLEEIAKSLQQRNIALSVKYSSTLHDREIRFNNGWIAKIGRGLDYFKAPAGKFALGQFDLDLRQCHATTVDIFHTQYTKSADSAS